MHSLILRYRAAPAILGTIFVLVIAGSLVWVDAFSPATLPQGFSSERQLLGIDLLLILIPSYLIFAWALLYRRSAVLLEEVDALVPDGGFRQRLGSPAWIVAAGAVAGSLYAVLFNLPVGSLAELAQGGPLLICLVTWMVFVWVCAGVVLGLRLYVSGLFLQAGKVVPIDPFELSPLEPFARSGMADMLFVVGTLVLTIVQSIDATFRYQNYLWALLVALPALLALLFRPMWSIHERLKVIQRDELAAVNELIRAAPKTLGHSEVASLEPLLQRRDRVRGLSTWPINISMVTRLIVYGVIPPIAWVAAALVEQLVESLLE